LATSTTINFPLGPYHPALAQPFALTLRLRGEKVTGVLPPGLGYGRRGVVDLVEGKSPDDALPIIERTCSLAHETHRIAFCQALEMATNTTIDRDAEITRVLFAEIERLLARLWTLALAARAASAAALHETALQQRESLFTALEATTGKRHYWGISVPGGTRNDLTLEPLQEALERLQPEITAWRTAVAPTGLLGRPGNGIGIISDEQALAIGLEGVARSGSSRASDLRATEQYAAYADFQTELGNKDSEADEASGSVGSKSAGDVTSRLAAAAADLLVSHAIAQKAVSKLQEEDRDSKLAIAIPAPHDDVSASSVVEGPHGPVSLGYTYTRAGVITELMLETPAGRLVQALPHLLEGRLLPQVPLILASLDPCIECIDL
jgi:Ni,Fe-hydrogenase III large subunit